MPRPPTSTPRTLDLKHFLLRAESLHLYRAFLRVASRAPGGGGGGGISSSSSSPSSSSSSPRAELVKTIRSEFERASGAAVAAAATAEGKDSSTQAIKHAIADGKLQLKRLEEMLGMQR